MPWEPPLLEREHETQVLGDALAQVVSTGSGRLLLVEGDAGLGKTRLLRHMRNTAVGSGHAVLSARASALQGSFGFGVARQLLEHGRATREQDETGDPSEPARLHGLYWQLADLCREPTVVLVDDLHHCDPESLRFLEYLRVRLDDLPLLLAVAARAGENDSPSPGATWRADADTIVVRPRPLGLLASARLLTALLGRSVDPAFAEAARQGTAGNPLLLGLLAGTLAREGVEAARTPGDPVPTSVSNAARDQVERRLDRLSPDVRRLAEAVAALGDGRAGLVAEVVGAPTPTVVEGANVLADLGLLEGPTDAPEPELAFRHPLCAEAVLSLMPEDVRQRLVHRCADVLESRGEPAEQVAAHVLALSPGADPSAVGRLLRAAAEAERRGALESAVGYLDRCLREDLDDDQRLEALTAAGTISLRNDVDQGVSFLERAVETASGREDPELWALLGTAYGHLRRPDAAVDAMEHAVRLLPHGDDDRRRQWEASLLVGAAVAPERRDLVERIERLRRLPAADGVGARMLDGVLGFHEMVVCEPHGAERAARAVRDGVLVERANGEGPLVCAWVTLAAADDPLGLQSLDDAVRLAQEHGSLRALSAALSVRAFALLRAGRPVDTADDARGALGHALGGRVDLDPRFSGAFLAEALLEAGELTEAEETLRTIGAFTADDTGPRYHALDAAARLRRLQGRHAEALRIAEDAGAVWSEYGFDNPALGSWRSEAALASYALGDVDRAVTLADADLARARSWQASGALGRALRVRGLVTTGDAGTGLLDESVDILEGSLAKVELARSLAAQGAALRRAGRRTTARDVLSRALDLAERRGAALLVAEVLTELRRAGFRPRRRRQTGPESLTSSERRVAELAARGTTNRAIAQLLFVSTKTVELHLTNAYRKLGVEGRHQLGAALDARGA